MNQKKQLTILEFSRLTGIKRENLRFYDSIGLLSPESRGTNNYRYYSRRQLNTAYLISSLRGLGVGIETIKQYASHHTPEDTLALLSRQEAHIKKEIRQLNETSQIMRIHSDMIREALAHNKNALFLTEKERESIFLCPPIPDGMDDDEGGIFSYEYADAHGVNLGFPLGTFVARERFSPDSVSKADSYYFKVGSGGNAWKPAGMYAVAYGQCNPWEPEALYERLLCFISQQNLYIFGDAYEEYPLGDTAVQDGAQYCVRIEIPVTARAPAIQDGTN